MLDGVLVADELVAEAVVEGVSTTGLCRLCRVRFRLSTFGESPAIAVLLASPATDSTADSFELRAGTAVNNKSPRPRITN